jgi:Mn2+/Fe2+ NRAMP family transporter
LKDLGKVGGLVVGPAVAAVGIATAQPEILGTGIAVTAFGGVSYVGGTVLKGVSNITLKHYCPGF